MPQKIILKLVSALTVFSILLSGCSLKEITPAENFSAETNWETLEEGLKLEKISIEDKHFIVLSIDPQKFSLHIIENQQDQKERKSIQDIHKENSSKATFNGGFFSPQYQPTGLLFSNGKELYPLIKAKLLNGIYWIDQNKVPHLSTYTEFKNLKNINPEFAIQNGPILLDEKGEIALSNNSSKNKSSRTAIGIDKNNQIIVILLKQTLLDNNNSLSLYEFAKFIKESPQLKENQIHSLLNLDGGTSTGLTAGEQYFPELEKVQNVIITKKRDT